jgi:hypothetical protein
LVPLAIHLALRNTLLPPPHLGRRRLLIRQLTLPQRCDVRCAMLFLSVPFANQTARCVQLIEFFLHYLQLLDNIIAFSALILPHFNDPAALELLQMQFAEFPRVVDILAEALFAPHGFVELAPQLLLMFDTLHPDFVFGPEPVFE